MSERKRGAVLVLQTIVKFDPRGFSDRELSRHYCNFLHQGMSSLFVCESYHEL